MQCDPQTYIFDPKFGIIVDTKEVSTDITVRDTKCTEPKSQVPIFVFQALFPEGYYSEYDVKCSDMCTWKGTLNWGLRSVY